MKLTARLIEKPWGRNRLPAIFGPTDGRRIGEIWFEGAENLPLLVKYIFTSERLSIQVHPDDRQARAAGFASGKTECWYILDADEGAVIGLGLKRRLTKEELRSAALDGSIEALLDWRRVRPGEAYVVPAGTVHAIGAGISLLELQQNGGTTFRLYDYGRPRDLHVEQAVAVGERGPYFREPVAAPADSPMVLADDSHLHLLQCVGGQCPTGALDGRRRWIVPITGAVRAGVFEAGPGECLLASADEPVDLGEGQVLIGAEGPVS